MDFRLKRNDAAQPTLQGAARRPLRAVEFGTRAPSRWVGVLLLPPMRSPTIVATRKPTHYRVRARPTLGPMAYTDNTLF